MKARWLRVTILEHEGDEVRGEKLILVFRKREGKALVSETSGHRATRAVIKGLPARAIIDKSWRMP